MDLRVFFFHMKANGVKFVLLTKFKKKKVKIKNPTLKLTGKEEKMSKVTIITLIYNIFGIIIFNLKKMLLYS